MAESGRFCRRLFHYFHSRNIARIVHEFDDGLLLNHGIVYLIQSGFRRRSSDSTNSVAIAAILLVQQPNIGRAASKSAFNRPLPIIAGS